MEVKSLLRKHNIRPNKRLGQNFLIDENIQKKIIDTISLGKEDTVLEVGPGLGALTKDLSKSAKKLIAVEKDTRLYNFLLKNVASNNLELIHGDILKYDFSNLASHSLKVFGNLPYYISSPILIHLIENRSFIDSVFITVQKEFAQRVVASPGSKVYGSISCFVQFYTQPHILFNIKRHSFYPVPLVDSCFLRLCIRRKPLYLTDEGKLFKIIRGSFTKRRKTISNSLYSTGMFSSKEELLEKLKRVGILPNKRAEEISLEKFVDLANIA